MPNEKVSQMTALTAGEIAPEDIFLVGDITARESKKMTADELLTFIEVSGSFNADSATLADTASYILGSNVHGAVDTASYALNARSASHALVTDLTISSSYAKTASYVSLSGLSIDTASYLKYQGFPNGTASFALIAGAAINATNASYLVYSTNNGTASYAVSGSFTVSASYARTASVVVSASYAKTASFVESSSYAKTASFVDSSSYSKTASISLSSVSYQSSEYTIVDGLVAYATHGLGAVPTVVQGVLVAKTTDEGGYAINDMISFESLFWWDGGSEEEAALAFSTGRNATHVWVNYMGNPGSHSPALSAANKTAAGRFAITISKWKVKIFATR